MAVVGQAAQAAADDSEEASSDDIVSTPDNKKGLTAPAIAFPCKSQRGRMFDLDDLAGPGRQALSDWSQGSEPRQGSRRRSSIGETPEII